MQANAKISSGMQPGGHGPVLWQRGMQYLLRRTMLAAALVLSGAAHAQTSRGTVTGTVLDSSGAAIANARLNLTAIDMGVRLWTNSNQAGVYRFDAVDLGDYKLQVTHPGFRTYFAGGINVEANRATTIDPKLEVGA